MYKVSTIAAWVAIVFTIASFVRDYLDITKDSPLSPQESWELQNDFRLSCEYDRRAELQSDACDLALSKPASPPPGISKRALHEPSVKRESCNTLCPRIRTGNVAILSLNGGRSTPQAAAFVDCFFEWTNILLLLGVAIISTRFHKLPRRRREQARNICSGTPSAPSRKEQDTVPSGPSEQPHENENGIGPMLWSEVVATSVAFVVLLLQVTWIYSLPSYKGLVFGAYEGEVGFPIGLHYRQIAGAFAAAAVYVSNSLLAPRVIARQNLYAKMANETIDTAPSLSRLQATVMDRVVRQR